MDGPWSRPLQALTHLKHFFILSLMNNFDNHSALFYLPDAIQKVNNQSCKKRSVLHLNMGILKKKKGTLMLQEVGILRYPSKQNKSEYG